MNADVKVVFHVCACSHLELDMGYIPKLGTKNYLCIFKATLQNSIAKNILELFDDHLIMETLTDYSGFEEFFGKYLTNPKETRVVAWIDEDVKICGQLRQKYGIPGDDIEASKICDDKHVTKGYLRKSGVKCADFFHFRQIKDHEIDQTVEKVEKQLAYPLFGKPTNLSTARCTEEIKNREGLINYFKFSQNYPHLEFMIEQFLEGKHYQIEAIIIEGKIVFDMVMHYPNPCQSTLFGKPLGCYLISFEDPVYKKAHESLCRLIACMPHIFNTTMFFEFVFMNDEVYVMETCKRKSGIPCMIFYHDNTGINFEEALVKLEMGRFDFYVPDKQEFKQNTGYVMYMKNTGKITKKNPYPPLTSSIKEFDFTTIGEVSKLANRDEKRDKSLLVFLTNPDRELLAKEVQLLLNWEPFLYT